jgi:hypothetical protein
LEFDLLHAAAIIIGIGIFIDGLGSIIMRGNQYHNVWFDGERLIRAIAGLILFLLALLM